MKKIQLNLFQKFVFSFISAGLLPIIIISYYSGTFFTSKAKDMITDNYRLVTIYGVKNLDKALDSYNSLTKMLYTYNDQGNSIFVRSSDGQGLARILRSSDGSQASDLRKSIDVINFTRLVFSSDKYIKSAIFVEKDNSYYYSSEKNVILEDIGEFFNIVNHKNNIKKSSELIIASPHEDSYFARNRNKVFTIGRNYFDLSLHIGKEEVLGTLYMDISVDMIDNIFEKLSVYNDGEIFVVDSNGLCIYSNKPEYAMKYYEPPNKDNIIDIVEKSEKTDWQVIIRVDYSEVMKKINNLVKVLYFIVIVCVFALILLSFGYSRMFSKPVKKLLAYMKEMESGNLDVAIEVKSGDEIGQLSIGFNNMTHELKNYIETSLLAQIRRKEAELNALKTQIQPHFIYNSLEIIRMNAVTNGDSETAGMAYLLAKQLRYLIGEVNETVTLRQELDMVRDYFEFINIRYNHKISLINSVNEKYLDASILKLSIQPIVENSVIHGIKPKGFGKVMILAELKGEDLAITILDNGIGMEEDNVNSIEKHLNNDGIEFKIEQDKISIGLKNVHDRLRYKYGHKYGILVTSKPKIGTSITILQPFLKLEQ